MSRPSPSRVAARFAVCLHTVWILTAAWVASGAAVYADNMILNGGFETPTADSGIISIAASGSTPSGFAWGVQAGQVEITRQGYIGGTFGQSPFTGPAYEGLQWLDLDGESVNGLGTLTQTFATASGSRYDLTFAYASNPYRGYSGPAKATVRLVDAFTTSDLTAAFQVSHGSSTGSDYDWKVQGPITFTATGATTTLRFSSDNPFGSDAGILLDGISVVAAVPEPSTLALAGASAILAYVVRRRRLP
jgi:hypothetical protein